MEKKQGYLYEAEIFSMIAEVDYHAKTMGCDFIMDYLMFKNDVCPECREPMNVVDNQIMNAAGIRVVLSGDISKGIMIPYAHCNTCGERAENDAAIEQSSVSKYVMETLSTLEELHGNFYHSSSK